MAKIDEVHKCTICSNIVLVIRGGVGELICCGQPMQHLIVNTVDAVKEKHIPVVEVAGDIVTVKVGSVPHPMEEKHWIEWIELVLGDVVYNKRLKPGNKPEASFCICGEIPKDIKVREYCNLHGLWATSPR